MIIADVSRTDLTRFYAIIERVRRMLEERAAEARTINRQLEEWQFDVEKAIEESADDDDFNVAGEKK